MKKHGNHGPERDELMERVRTECDQKNLPYPVELTQHLNAKLAAGRDEG